MTEHWRSLIQFSREPPRWTARLLASDSGQRAGRRCWRAQDAVGQVGVSSPGLLFDSSLAELVWQRLEAKRTEFGQTHSWPAASWRKYALFSRVGSLQISVSFDCSRQSQARARLWPGICACCCFGRKVPRYSRQNTRPARWPSKFGLLVVSCSMSAHILGPSRYTRPIR